jgi:Deoxynucleoside kinase
MLRLRVPDPNEEFPPLLIKPLDPFLGEGGGKAYLRILGSNGAGKSAFGRALRASDPEAFSFTGEDGKARLGTVFPNFGWAAVGYYTGRGGGADRLDKKEWIFESLFRLAGTALHIFIEGMTVTNTRESFWEVDLAMPLNFKRKPLLIFLDYSLEECLRRIYARNGGKAIKESYVDEIHRRVRKTVRLYEERIAGGAPVILRRESTLGVEAMVASLIQTVREVYGADVISKMDFKTSRNGIKESKDEKSQSRAI